MSLNLLASASVFPSPERLADILQADCNLAIWEREALSGMEEFFPVEARDIRMTCALDSLPAMLDSELDDVGFPGGNLRQSLVEDVSNLARRFAALLKLESVELRLEIVTGDACRKWHADYVSARLITTYHGCGTQWIDGPDAARVKQGLEPLCARSLRAGDVGIFKGRVASETPAIHRSPPISKTGERRLLLVLNPPEKH